MIFVKDELFNMTRARGKENMSPGIKFYNNNFTSNQMFILSNRHVLYAIRPIFTSKRGFLVTNSVKQQQFTYFHGEISTRLS